MSIKSHFTVNGKEIDFKGAIFDLDGTLLNSMHVWTTLAERYVIESQLIPRSDIRLMTNGMSTKIICEHLSSTYTPDVPPEKIKEKLDEILGFEYYNRIQMKPHVPEFLERLKNEGVRMAMITATPRKFSETVITKFDIRKYFEVFISTKEYGKGKSSPEVFYETAEMIGTKPENTVVFEDAYYCMNTAKNAGFYIACVDDKCRIAYEENKVESRDIVHALSDWHFDDYKIFLD